jgi:hypothetical protein
MSMLRMTTKRMALASAALSLAVLAAAPTAIQAQSGADLMKRAMDKQAERLAGVENVTITQDVMGMELVMYMEKRETEGGPILVPVTTIMAGMTNPVPQDEASADWSNPFQKEWADRSRIVGEEEVDGQACTVLAIEDFTDLEVPGLPGGQTEAGEFVPKALRFSVDEDDLVMRKMDMEAEVIQPDGTVSPVKVTVLMSDYRETEGYLHPFKTHTVTEGMMDAMDMDKEELKGQLAEVKQQMANMPEAMQGMMASQIERLESMIGEGGGLEVTLTVKSVKVNAGPPGGG